MGAHFSIHSALIGSQTLHSEETVSFLKGKGDEAIVNRRVPTEVKRGTNISRTVLLFSLINYAKFSLQSNISLLQMLTSVICLCNSSVTNMV